MWVTRNEKGSSLRRRNSSYRIVERAVIGADECRGWVQENKHERKSCYILCNRECLGAKWKRQEECVGPKVYKIGATSAEITQGILDLDLCHPGEGCVQIVEGANDNREHRTGTVRKAALHIYSQWGETTTTLKRQKFHTDAPSGRYRLWMSCFRAWLTVLKCTQTVNRWNSITSVLIWKIDVYMHGVVWPSMIHRTETNNVNWRSYRFAHCHKTI